MPRIDFLFGGFWKGWHLWAAWTVCIGVLFLLGMLRAATDAEFTFSSLAILPVLAIAWIGGRASGLFVAALATAMWATADILSERLFGSLWIPWTNAATRLMTYGLVALLVAQVRLLFEREHLHATHDALTGLQNRRAFLEAGDSEVARAMRYPHAMAVIYLDLDDFKQLNDSRGHAAGDTALQATAKALLAALRSSDRVARLGGDEFGILLPETGYDAAVEAARKVSKAANAALDAFPPVKISTGLAWFESTDRSFADMLKAADDLMYEVKVAGKHDMCARRFAAATTLASDGNRQGPAA